jgi:hypothetical protein
MRPGSPRVSAAVEVDLINTLRGRPGRGRVTEALNLAGVAVDDQLATLMGGEPTRIYRAELPETWLTNLYAGLTEAALWRFAAGYAAWLEERGRRPKPATMFGLKDWDRPASRRWRWIGRC